MKQAFLILAALSLLLLPAPAFAKAATTKITIEGGNLTAPIEITDPQVLAPFQVWTGPGTSSFESQQQSLICDWSQTVSAPYSRLQRYKVSFWAKLPKEKVVYVIFYEYDPAAKQGYVYLPGENDEWYSLNTSSLLHEVEGHWFRAWSAWDKVAGPLLAAHA